MHAVQREEDEDDEDDLSFLFKQTNFTVATFYAGFSLTSVLAKINKWEEDPQSEFFWMISFVAQCTSRSEFISLT